MDAKHEVNRALQEIGAKLGRRDHDGRTIVRAAPTSGYAQMTEAQRIKHVSHHALMVLMAQAMPQYKPAQELVLEIVRVFNETKED